ncbi:MAG: nucleoside hydrolase [Planctomycetota bacterium]
MTSKSLTAGDLPKLVIDSDTANEIDDHYAIIRMIFQDKYEVVGLTSAQWFHYLGDANSVEASQRENENLLRLLGRTDLPVPMGASRPMGKPWGGTDAKDSPAARFIIEQAKKLGDGEFLTVCCTGATTNVASAIKIAPEIASKIKLYLMGYRHDPLTGVWDKSEFNIRRDLNAADFLLNHADVEMHVMSATVSLALRFDRTETKKRCEALGPVGDYLVARWDEHASENQVRIMWDLALVEAMLVDDLATEKLYDTPPENTQRKIHVYDTIDAKGMESDFWKVATEGIAAVR